VDGAVAKNFLTLLQHWSGAVSGLLVRRGDPRPAVFALRADDEAHHAQADRVVPSCRVLSHPVWSARVAAITKRESNRICRPLLHLHHRSSQSHKAKTTVHHVNLADRGGRAKTSRYSFGERLKNDES
jgi:hypothetical protein